MIHNGSMLLIIYMLEPGFFHLHPTWAVMIVTTGHQIRNENDLTGKIPTEVGLLSSLTFLSLGPNRLTGKLPTEIGLLTSLTDLRLYFNTFTGTLPTEIGLLTSLNYLYLNDNIFTGTVPATIWPGLSNAPLYSLRLSNNAFNGSVPQDF